METENNKRAVSKALAVLLGLLALLVLGALIWQALTARGNPDPTAKNLSPVAVILSSGVLVLREGLEAILVLAALTAGLTRTPQNYGRAIALGTGLALFATIATWFVVVAIISEVNAPELDIQAATGLLAIVVLLVVMNWFFHRIYWTGWIAHHNKRKRELVETPKGAGTFWGLAALGFTATYREGFEVVLFLQDLRLHTGTRVVLEGAAVGLALTVSVGALTFVAHQHLPYKKMLIATGILLAGVLVVMVGESAQELQQANWIPTHAIALALPDWAGVWFAVFPNVEGLAAQFAAAVLVIGSYAWARYRLR